MSNIRTLNSFPMAARFCRAKGLQEFPDAKFKE